MLKYLLGFLKNLFNPAVSLFSKVDNLSCISCKARVYGRVQVSSSTIGDYSYVGRDARIIHSDIGKFCSIAGESVVGMGTHTIDKLSSSSIFTEAKNGTKHSWVNTSEVTPFERSRVGNDVWIGMRAMVLGGKTIGDGAVIAAGSIVTKDVPPYAIVAGIPAKVIRFRFSQEVIECLEALQWWDLPEDVLKMNISLFQSDHVDIEKIEQVVKENRK